MRIERVCSGLYRIPVHREMHDAIRHFSKMDLAMVHVETDEGLCGLGFTYSIIPFGAREVCSLVNRGLGQLIHDIAALFVEYIPSLDPVLTEPLKLVDGCFVPSEEPGLGISFDFDRLSAFKVKDEN